MKPIYINIAIGLMVLFLLYKFSQKIGLVDTAEDVEAEKLTDSNYFTRSYWKEAGKGARLLTVSDTRKLVSKLVSSAGFVTEDEESIIQVFKNLKSKSQVSWLADWFEKITTKNLVSFLTGNLNADELSRIYKHTNNLPRK
jgi:hypothetical protein